MKFAFLLFDYFPFGGLERDCVRIASACVARGHEATILTRTWEGERPANITVELFGRHGLGRTSENRHWLKQLAATLPQRNFDCVVGCNKLPGLDVYFGADLCFAARIQNRPFWYRWLPRPQYLLATERAVFGRGSKTEILVLTTRDITTYQKFYNTEDRFTVLPANATRRQFTPEQQNAARLRIRESNGWPPTTKLLLFVGSDFRRKGLDRAIRGLSTLNQDLLAQTQLAVLGQDDTAPFAQQARDAGVADHVHFFGGRNDAPDWMLAADALVHPAYRETAGAVLVEALASGLPVLTTAACGYAFHVTNAKAGIVLPEPFRRDDFDRALPTMLTSPDTTAWRTNALSYAATTDLYGCHERAAEIIERVALGKKAAVNRPSGSSIAPSDQSSFGEDAMIHFEKAGVRWQAQPDIAPLLDEILAAPRQTIKESPAKLVTANTVRGKIYYVKHYRHSAVPFRPLKFYFKPSQAVQEWELAQKLEAFGLPIVRHAALGERWTWAGLQESILITENFNGKTLDQVPDVDPAAVQRLVDRMHELGVIQFDLHEGNILASPETGEIRLVDLYHTEIRPHLSKRERMMNLALLRIDLPIKVSPEIQELSRRERQQRLHTRSRRCLSSDPRFTIQRFGGLKWRVRTQFQNANVERILDSPDEFLDRRAKILKPGRSSTVGSADGLVLKRFNLRKYANLFKDLFRRSKARQSFQKAYHLELAGIPTARPVAVAERRIARLLLRAYVLMEEIPGATDLGQWHGDKAATIESLAALLARLHHEGFSHRDLKETNLLFDRDGKLFLIDLEGLKFMATVPFARSEADLARLDRGLAGLSQFTTQDRAAFRKRYDELRTQLATGNQ